MSERVLERIKNLLALATNNPSVEEAALAASRASELMHKYNIGATDLEIEGEADEELADEVFHHEGKLSWWRGVLAQSIARSVSAECLLERGRDGVHYRLLGTKPATQTAAYIFAYLTKEIQRLAESARTKEYEPARNFRTSFCQGAAQVLAKRLNEQTARNDRSTAAVNAGTPGLVRYQNDQERLKQLLKDVMAGRKVKQSRSSAQVDYSGWTAGEAAGHSMALGGGKELSEPKKNLRG
jgi:hypothetical protein